MPSIPAPVEISVLRWARESSGLTQIAAARKIGLPDGRVTAWESGEAVPTIAQLRKAAEVYKRSLAVFFLSEPPVSRQRQRSTPASRRRLPGITTRCGKSVRISGLVPNRSSGG